MPKTSGNDWDYISRKINELRPGKTSKPPAPQRGITAQPQEPQLIEERPYLQPTHTDPEPQPTHIEPPLPYNSDGLEANSDHLASGELHDAQMAAVDQRTPAQAIPASSPSAASSAALDAYLLRLVSIWPQLSDRDREEVYQIARLKAYLNTRGSSPGRL